MRVLNNLLIFGAVLVIICLVVRATQSSGNLFAVPAFDAGLGLLVVGGLGRLYMRMGRELRDGQR